MALSRVLVTGGAGYIGSVVSACLLREGYAVRVFDNLSFGSGGLLPLYMYPKFSFVRGDIRDVQAVTRAREGVDCVVHLAAIVGDPACAQEPEQTKQVNYEGTCSLANLTKESGVRRFIFTSTCSNYGMRDTSQMADEDSPLKPLSLYARTKVQAEQFVLGLASEHFNPCVLRLSTVFGLSSRMRFDLLINEFTRDAMLCGKIVIYGERFWRPYIHTADVAEAILLCLKAPVETVLMQTFNVGHDTLNYQKGQIAEMLLRQVPGTVVERVPQTTDPRDYRVSFAKIETELNFQAKRSIQQGIREIVEVLKQDVITDPYSARYRNTR